MLILLGAAGGALRGLLDAYNRILDWQADRSAYRQLPAGEEGEPPRISQYFDPVAAPIAALAHSLMGAVVAVLVGTTGQINGAFAAILVGISAPAILTQLGRIPPVSNAVTGASPEGTGVEGDAAPQPGTSSQWAAQADPEPRYRPSATTNPPHTTPIASSSASVSADQPSPGLLASNLQPDTSASEPRPTGRPVDREGRRGRDMADHEPPHPHGPAIGEEGATS